MDWENQVSFTLFTFATIDRLLSTQRLNKYRQRSNRVSLAYKLSITCLLFCLLLFGHRLILYSTTDGQYSPLSGFYDDFDNYFEVVFVGMFPPIVMSLLAYLLIRNVRGVIQRQITSGNNMPQTTRVHRTVLQQMDSQLTLILMLQSVITMITYVPYAVELIYSNISKNWLKSPLQNAQEKIFVEFTHL